MAAKKKPRANGKAGPTGTKREVFKLDATLSRMTALCGDVQLRCVVAAHPQAFYASAWVGGDYCVGVGKSAGYAIKKLHKEVSKLHSIDEPGDSAAAD